VQTLYGIEVESEYRRFEVERAASAAAKVALVPKATPERRATEDRRRPRRDAVLAARNGGDGVLAAIARLWTAAAVPRRSLLLATLGGVLTAAAPVAEAANADANNGRAGGGARSRCRRDKKRGDGRCVAAATDRKHCGRCDRACRRGERCVDGGCVLRCSAALDAAGCGFAQPDIRQCSPDDELRGVVLAGCDLTFAFLQNVDFTGANLSGADLTGATLTGADFSDADLSGVVWGGACPDGTNSSTENPPTCCGHLNGKTPRAGC
jgi:hypothetical protein